MAYPSEEGSGRVAEVAFVVASCSVPVLATATDLRLGDFGGMIGGEGGGCVWDDSVDAGAGELEVALESMLSVPIAV